MGDEEEEEVESERPRKTDYSCRKSRPAAEHHGPLGEVLASRSS